MRYGAVSIGVVLCLLAGPGRAVDCAGVEKDPDMVKARAMAVLAREPGNMAAQECRATADFHAGEFKAAAAQFLALAGRQADPAAGAALQSKAGWAFMRNHELGQAGKAFHAAIKLQPQAARYWQDHAMVLMQTEQFWDARRELDYALTLLPRDAALWALRADCWLKLGVAAQAKRDARVALALEPGQTLAAAVMQKIGAGE